MALVPTPVTKADLASLAADINKMNDGVAAQEVQPRYAYQDWVTVLVTDAKPEAAYYTQKHFTGEWIKGGSKLGGDVVDADGDDVVILPV